MKRSKYFLEGFKASRHGTDKTHNPYAAGQPWLSEDKWKMVPYVEWELGWRKHFHGESIGSEP